MRDGRRLYDGIDELDRLGGPNGEPTTVTAPCPVCDTAVVVDAVAVVERGDSAFAAAREGRIGADALASIASALGLTMGAFDGVAYLRGRHGLTAHLLGHTCATCGSRLTAVASYGEFQPARWQLWFDGLVVAGDDGEHPSPR
ncbi:MAG: hypothetical protein KDB40_19985 [Acidimicrobiales bacterium]|nr:hypothetical protein [Acidimicrobiales bacterium]MCB9392293.1 hypothetical protein [Acidimicrobiaceae bacterium]